MTLISPCEKSQIKSNKLSLAILANQAKLNRVPVEPRQLLNFDIGGANTGQAKLLAEIGNFLNQKHGHMAQDLVHQIGLKEPLKPSELFDRFTSGEWPGREAWRMYMTQGKARKARQARNSRAEQRPVAGRKRNPVRLSRKRLTAF